MYTGKDVTKHFPALKGLVMQVQVTTLKEKFPSVKPVEPARSIVTSRQPVGKYQRSTFIPNTRD
jgi:hypothetical protein